MVKRKSPPRPRTEAGFAARTEQPVHDTTMSESSEETDDTSSSNNSSDGAPTPVKQIPKNTKTAAAAPTTSSKQTGSKTTANKLSTQSKEFKAKAKPGMVALKEIKRLQSSTRLIIPRAPFLRVVKEIIQNRTNSTMRCTEMAVEALREASENVLTSIFEDSYLVACHAKRVTLMPRDMALVLNLRRDFMSGTVGGK